ncbi:MAG: CBS domain-containing protein [Thermoproteota archaeon]|nr:CBS domain-containing protein [Candidatus Brockarchaeota archaeon]
MPIIKRSRKFPIRAEDIMSFPPVTARADTLIEDVAKLMYDNNVGSVMIVDNAGVIVGIMTERDLIYAVANGKVGKGLPVHMIMTENPITVGPDVPIDETLRIMREKNIRHLPVVDSNKKPVGMISLRDVIDAVVALMKVYTS